MSAIKDSGTKIGDFVTLSKLGKFVPNIITLTTIFP